MSKKEQIMESLPRIPLSFNIALTGLMTALVCVATIAFQIYLPFSQGYINAGEGVIYVTAILFGPIIGGLAGGLGSMLANIFLGFTQYAPGVAFIKGAEGAVVGFLGYRFRSMVKKWWKPLSIVMCGGVAGLVLYVGISYFSGWAEIYGGVRPWWWNPALFMTYFQWGWWYQLVYISWWVWPIVSLCIGLLFLYLGLRVDASTGWSVLSILVGGLCMVICLLIYEELFLGVAATSIAFNIAQILLGIIIAIPVERFMKKISPEIFV
ncbi:MAG: ECF transporter S component [Candidatus Lokiarchaeia archaeon]